MALVNKITKIFNVGRFHSYTAKGDVTFKKNTLIFGENGKGKSTLTSILKSLKTDNPHYITERVTVNSGIKHTNQEIELLIENAGSNKSTSFKSSNAKWSTPLPSLKIFDTEFINSNIFSGEIVSHDHKKNFCLFALGDSGVALAKRINEIDIQIRDLNVILNKGEAVIRSHINSDTDLEKYFSLNKHEKVEDEITEKEKELSAINNAVDIKAKKQLSRFSYPNLSFEEVEGILNKSLGTISKDAERRVTDHIKKHTRGYDFDARWFKTGFGYVGSEKECPFCDSDLTGNKLIESYSEYFGEEYSNLKEEVSRMDDDYKSKSVLSLERSLRENDTLLDSFWSNFIATKPKIKPELDLEGVRRVFENVRTILRRYLKLKSADILSVPKLQNDWESAKEELLSLGKTLKEYNEKVDSYNILIAAKKAEVVDTTRKLTVTSELNLLKDIKNRHESPMLEKCNKYLLISKEKEVITKEKEEKKKELDLYTRTILDQYQEEVNQQLRDIGTNFEIINLKTQFIGGQANSDYALSIHGVDIPLGKAETVGEPCFRSALSNGDKSTLAFAFFMARLKNDPSLSDSILVYDDPITSLDSFRKGHTISKIFELADKVQQSIILSHDLDFLKETHDRFKAKFGTQVKNLLIKRTSLNESTIEECDIDKISSSMYKIRYEMISDYVEKGIGTSSSLAVAQSLRPLLEEYLRMKFPMDFTSNFWLGDLIGQMKSNPTPRMKLYPSSQLLELEEIKDYAKKFHHSAEAPAYDGAVDDTELAGYAKRALAVIAK